MDCNLREDWHSRRLGISHWDWLHPFYDISIHRNSLIFGSPLVTTVLYCNVEPGRESSKANSNVCCPDTYLIVNNLPSRNADRDKPVHVITVLSSKSSSACERIVVPDEDKQ